MENCTICQRKLVDPKTLPCLHSFCSNGLIKLKKGKNSKEKEEEEKTRKGKKKKKKSKFII